MKYFAGILAVIFLVFSFGNVYSASNSIFRNTTNETPYCNDGECGINKGVEAVKDVDVLETERKASEYIQDVVKYILGFLALVATLLIIYSGFKLLVSVGDEEQTKESKRIILYAILGIIIIFLAGRLINFILGILV